MPAIAAAVPGYAVPGEATPGYLVPATTKEPVAGAFIPGYARPGIMRPGYLAPGAPPPTGVTVTTTPALAGACQAHARRGRCGTLHLTTGTATVYLGGPEVTSASGFPVAAGTTVAIPLFSGDQVWAVTASGTTIIYPWQAGG